MNYHLTDDGPKRCSASKRPCPLGGQHFSNVGEARTAYEVLHTTLMSLKRSTNKVLAKKIFDDLFERPDFSEEVYRAKAKEFFDQCSEDETDALRGFANSSYYDINLALYGGKGRKKVANLIHALDSALLKAPEPPKALWRSLSGFDLPRDFIKEGHEAGETITFKGYMSTSETPDALMHIPNDLAFYMKDTPSDEWVDDPNRMFGVLAGKEYTDGPALNAFFKINAKQAAPVSVMRQTVNEQEWLIPRGKRFRITKIHRNVSVGDLKYLRSSDTRAQIFELDEI